MKHRRARLGATGTLTTAPLQLGRHRDRRRPLVTGALVFKMASGRWQAANFASWSDNVCRLLGDLGRGDTIDFTGRLNLGNYLAFGRPRTRVYIELETAALYARRKPSRKKE